MNVKNKTLENNKTMNRDFKGIWIPKEVWLNQELKLIEKIFLVEIDSLDNENGCFASNQYFANFFGISKGRCSQIISELEKKGLIIFELKYKGKQVINRKIRVVNKLNRVVNNCRGGVKYIKGGYLENDKDNNTLTNNTINNKKKGAFFKKPILNDIILYCEERNNNVDAESFYDFYESKGWMVGKTKMKDWKACVRTWERRNKKESKVKERMNSHDTAKQMLKNIQNGN